MSKPIIAIVGRPNVGKSMLFNKLIGRRLSIVEDTPGVTRDRIYGQTDWNGRTFTLVDTGGIEPSTDNQILSFMREQAQIAIDNATVIVLVVDIKTGMTAADQEVANMLQPSPPSTATARATCSTHVCSISRRRTTSRTMTTSFRSPSSESPTSASPRSQTAFSASSASLSATSRARRATPSTRTLKTRRASSTSSTPLACARSRRSTTALRNTASCARRWPSSARTCA